MADGKLSRLPALQQPPVMPPGPPIQPSVPLVQPVVMPAQPIATQPIQPVHMPQLNWLHFKPEYAGEPNEDAETHRTNDWLNTDAFPEGVKFQHFCLTLVGEARL